METVEELKSMRLIIELLQQELSAKLTSNKNDIVTDKSIHAKWVEVSSRHSGVISNDKDKLSQKVLTSQLIVANRYSVLEEIATEESRVIHTAVGHNVVVDTTGKNVSINQEGPNVQNIVIGKTAWNPSDQQETQSIHELWPVVQFYLLYRNNNDIKFKTYITHTVEFYLL
jgi:hypothetical protein